MTFSYPRNSTRCSLASNNIVIVVKFDNDRSCDTGLLLGSVKVVERLG